MADRQPSQSVIDTSTWTIGAKVFTDVIARTTVHGTSALASRMHDMRNFDASSNVIDLGCGTGNISAGMLEQVDKLQIHNVLTQLEDGGTLAGLADNTFSHEASSFAISFIPDPKRAVESLYRVVKPGGAVRIVLWGARVDWRNAVQKATNRIQPEYAYRIPEDPLAWRSEESHRAALEAVGLQNVRAETVKMPLATNGLQGAREYAFRGGNPVMQRMISDFVKQGGEVEELERVYAQVLDEEYSGGVSADTILGWGTKPN